MPLTLKEIKDLHDKAYNFGQVTRERAADDLVFYWVTQWDDNSLDESQLGFRGEFDILRKAGRGILADLNENQVQVDFKIVDGEREEDIEFINGVYRTDDTNNLSIEAYGVGQQEAVICGVGAWELVTEYSSIRGADTKQVIRRKPIHEANNTVFFDPNAKLLDRSDANYVCILKAYSEDGYKKLVKELTGEEPTQNIDTFKSPEESYVFPWIGGEGKKVYVGTFYHREKVDDKHITFISPLGETKTLLESAFEESTDELIDAGYTLVSEKKVERWEVRKYICSGFEILNGETKDDERTGEVINGEYIPVVTVYGEHAIVEGETHYEGVTRLAKDPQRLRNFVLSYLGDICSRSPREKPIMLQEQVAGFEDMYSLSGSENNYPYLLQNRTDADGKDLPVGAIGMLPAPNIPPALIPLVGLTREAVEDVANPGLPQDIADPDLSGKAILALQAKLEKQSVVYQEHMKHAKRHDAQIYASMASEIYDVPQKVTLTLPDGTEKEVTTMETIIDEKTGELLVINDIYNKEFIVKSTIGPSYSSQKEKTIDRLVSSLQYVDPGDPLREAILLKILVLQDGVEFDDIKEYANKQLVLKGFKDPETDDEKAMLQQAMNQPQQPSAEMVLALAETKKGEAEMLNAQLKQLDTQLKAENESLKRQVDAFKAETDRMATMVDAQETGAKIENTNADTLNKNLEAQTKVIEMTKPELLSDDDLWHVASLG